jgi:hypothetical protein
MYRKNRVFDCKNRAKGWGGFEWAVFTHKRKSVKNFIKCLIFNDLLFYAILYASFTQALRKIAFLPKMCYNKASHMLKLLDFQRFRKHQASACLSMLLRIFTVLGGWVKGRVQSKGAKQG